MYIEHTECCALGLIVGANYRNANRIKYLLEDESYAEGRSLLVVAKTTEKGLITKLKKLGFKQIAIFPRRYQLQTRNSPKLLLFIHIQGPKPKDYDNHPCL